MRKKLYFFLLIQLTIACSPRFWDCGDCVSDALYLNNGNVQVGVDLSRGGTVFHFSDSETRKNLVNHYDEGREIQQSYYGNPDGSMFWGKPWCWNPIQGGGSAESGAAKAKVLSIKHNRKHLELESLPVLWGSGEYARDCLMKETISLEGKVVHITFLFRYDGNTEHAARHQEVPAFFADWDLNNFVCYRGDSPWTGDSLYSYVPADLMLTGSNEMSPVTEHWAAYVNDEGWGVGLYSPVSDLVTLYRYGSGPGGARAESCSYFAPVVNLAVTPGMTYEYDVYIVSGSVREIRDTFYGIHSAR